MKEVEQMKDMLTTSQVARELCVSAELVRYWMRHDRIAFVETPLGRLVSAEEVTRLKSERTTRKGEP